MMKVNHILALMLGHWADQFDDMAEPKGTSGPNKQLQHLANECRRVVARNKRQRITAATVSRFLKDMANKLDDMCFTHPQPHGVVRNVNKLEAISNTSRRMAAQIERGKENLEVLLIDEGLINNLMEMVLQTFKIPSTFLNKNDFIFNKDYDPTGFLNKKYYNPYIPKPNFPANPAIDRAMKRKPIEL
jgi:hypothetical protein